MHAGPRGDSAVSKNTTDSGVGLDAGETIVLPRTVPRILPPLQGMRIKVVNSINCLLLICLTETKRIYIFYICFSSVGSLLFL